MSIWQRLKRWRKDSQRKKKYSYISGEFQNLNLTSIDTPENQKLIPDPLAVSLSDHPAGELYQWWIMLSPREQDVTALTCLKYTNSQIAARLGLSKETVKTYLQKVLNKFGLHSKADLRVTFANWDFSEWERRESQRQA